jgi:hypothetical protein
MKSSRSVSIGLAILTLPIASVPYAQIGRESDTTFEMPTPIKDLGQAQVEAGEFTFVRIKYSSDGSYGEPWSIDYPYAEHQFLRQFEEITGVPAHPDGVVLELSDSSLAQYPFIYGGTWNGLRSPRKCAEYFQIESQLSYGRITKFFTPSMGSERSRECPVTM